MSTDDTNSYYQNTVNQVNDRDWAPQQAIEAYKAALAWHAYGRTELEFGSSNSPSVVTRGHTYDNLVAPPAHTVESNSYLNHKYLTNFPPPPHPVAPVESVEPRASAQTNQEWVLRPMEKSKWIIVPLSLIVGGIVLSFFFS